jgi:hypothetical protein
LIDSYAVLREFDVQALRTKARLSDSVAVFTDSASTGSAATLLVPETLAIYKGSLPGAGQPISGTRLLSLTSDAAVCPSFSAATSLASCTVKPGFIDSSTSLQVRVRKPDLTYQTGLQVYADRTWAQAIQLGSSTDS